MRKGNLLSIFLISFGSVGVSCSNGDNTTDTNIIDIIDFNNLGYRAVAEDTPPNLYIHEGLMCQNADTVRVLHNGYTAAVVILSEPIKIVQATKWERWGYYQFPKIYRSYNGNLIVRWQMKVDSHTAYGSQGYARMMSRDEGKTCKQSIFTVLRVN